MRRTDKEKEECWPNTEQLQKARQNLHTRLAQEELEYAMRFEIVDRLMTDLNVDPETFRRLWVQPLLTAGATLEVALVCIAKSHFQPN